MKNREGGGSINKTDHRDITEIVLKVLLNTITTIPPNHPQHPYPLLPLGFSFNVSLSIAGNYIHAARNNIFYLYHTTIADVTVSPSLISK
jgi:hypothetical protein